MELQDYLRIVRRSWPLIAFSVLLGLIGSMALAMASNPVYTSRTQLFVAIQGTGSISELQQGNTFSQARVQSYVRAATTPAVLQPTIDTLGIDKSPAELANSIQASADLNTVLITISAEDESPVQAAALAQSVTDNLVRVVQELEQPAQGGTSPVRLSVITPAVAAKEPSSPNLWLYLAVGMAAGLALGGVVSLARAAMDTRVRTEEDLGRATRKPILGSVLYDETAVRKPLITQVHHQSPRAESFRQIRTNLQFSNIGTHRSSILITSASPGEGKTTTATNIAIALAQAGQKVALVDADLRRPRVGEYLGLESGAGLTTALLGTASLNDLLQPWGPDDLHVLTSGQIPPNPSELLGSAAMRGLVVELESTFDVVIIDAPPLLPVTDAAVLGREVGGVVMVVGASKIRSKDLEKSIDSLELVGASIKGFVLNLRPAKGPDAATYSYYSYDAAENGSAKARVMGSRPTETKFTTGPSKHSSIAGL